MRNARVVPIAWIIWVVRKFSTSVDDDVPVRFPLLAVAAKNVRSPLWREEAPIPANLIAVLSEEPF